MILIIRNTKYKNDEKKPQAQVYLKKPLRK
jgi:hypothetical protein